MPVDRSRLPGSPRGRSAAAWGLVGSLSFLVLHQAYLLLGGAFLGFGPIAAIALAVGVLTWTLAYAARPRLAAANEQS